MIDPTSPLGDTLREQIEALIAQWREIEGLDTLWDDGYESGLRHCADELAALVRAVPLGVAQETSVDEIKRISSEMRRYAEQPHINGAWAKDTIRLWAQQLSALPPAPVEPAARAEEPICTCRHDSGMSTDCAKHYPASPGVEPAAPPHEDPLQGIRDAKYLNPVCAADGCQWLRASTPAACGAASQEPTERAKCRCPLSGHLASCRRHLPGIPSQCGDVHPMPPHSRCLLDHGHEGAHQFTAEASAAVRPDFNPNYTQCSECGGTFRHYGSCQLAGVRPPEQA